MVFLVQAQLLDHNALVLAFRDEALAERVAKLLDDHYQEDPDTGVFVTGWELDPFGTLFYIETHAQYFCDDLGGGVFAVREEAEQALEKYKQEGDDDVSYHLRETLVW